MPRCRESLNELIPSCPPHNTILLHGESEYFFYAHANRKPYKATYDLVVDLQ